MRGPFVYMFKTFTCVVVMAAVLSAAPGPMVSLKVNQQVSMAPTVLRFTVTIEPFEGNRKACLAYDGGEAGLTCYDVQGDKHPRTEWFERRIGAEGEYFASLTLVSVVCKKDRPNDCDVKHTTATTTFIVTAPGVPFVR